MSKDIIVLAPNGKRQKVHCTPNTSILQVLEDVCHKQGFEASDYNLKHHNHILDLTTTVRFSNLPNKATLEMVEAERKREESVVTVGLLLEDGDRRTADFQPNTSLFDLVTTLAPNELQSLLQPTILYMRQEVVGEMALKEKTLRQLGLIGGRAILRLFSKGQDGRQANVSKVYRQPFPQKPLQISDQSNTLISDTYDKATAGPSNINKVLDPINLLKQEKQAQTQVKSAEDESKIILDQPAVINTKEDCKNSSSSSTLSLNTQETLERRLNIEEEVTFLGTQKAVAFMQPDEFKEELDDLPDDFYELTIEEVRKLYHDLQQNRTELENTPLMTSSRKQDIEKQTSLQLKSYKNVVVRVQFPDRIILQGVFTPADKIEDVINFIKCYLQDPEKPFDVFTTPLKETLNPQTTLLEAKYVPCVHMHFKWAGDATVQSTGTYLREDVYSRKTTNDAASILASKYRAPSRRKIEDKNCDSQNAASGSKSSKNSKVPKWFKK